MGPLQISDIIPDIELPKFSGKQQEWITFIGEFDTLIDSADLSDAVKFCYLRRCLCDNAKSAIDGFALTDYQKAIDVLHERFGDRSENVDSHVNAICNLRKPDMYPENLLKFYDKLQKHARILDQLDFSVESMNLLLSVVKKKLPDEVKVDVYRSCERPYNFKSYCQSLYQEISAHCNASVHGTCQVQSSQGDKGPCAYCKKHGHSPLYCSMVSNPSARLEAVKTDRLCFNCLGPHKLTNCHSKFTCRVCGSSHHTTLHEALGAQTQRGNDAEKAGLQRNPVIRPTTRPLKEHWNTTISRDGGPRWRVLEINHSGSRYTDSKLESDSDSVYSDSRSENWVTELVTDGKTVNRISDDMKTDFILNACSREKVEPQTVADCTLMDSEAETSLVDTVEISSCSSEDSYRFDEDSDCSVHDELKLNLNPEVLNCGDVPVENEIEITDENSHSSDVHVQNKRSVSDETSLSDFNSTIARDSHVKSLNFRLPEPETRTRASHDNLLVDNEYSGKSHSLLANCEGDPRLSVDQSHGNHSGTVHANNLPTSSLNSQSGTLKIVQSRPPSKLSMAKQGRFINRSVMYLSLCAVILILLLWSTEFNVVGDSCSSYLYISILIAVPVILTRSIVAISNFFDSNQFKVRVYFQS